MKLHDQDLPLTRVGHCCGCNAFDGALYKVPHIFRYRCAPCYERETGTWPWLAPPKPEKEVTPS